jgi:hypothetical protein
MTYRCEAQAPLSLRIRLLESGFGPWAMRVAYPKGFSLVKGNGKTQISEALALDV